MPTPNLNGHLKEETLVLNMGPQHPSTHGVLRLILELDGETVRRCRPDIGFLHTGVEKECEYRNYNQIFTLIERLDYLAGLHESLAYALAVERLLNVEAPARAQTVRVLLCELSRLASHLIWLGSSTLEVNMSSVFMYCMRTREEILDLFEMVGGSRMFPFYFRVGGLAWELPQGFSAEVERFVKTFPGRLQELEDLVSDNWIWLERTQGIGRVSLEICKQYGLTGPTLRACGEPFDIRRAYPYSGYDRFQFDVPTGTQGDAYERYRLRMVEMHQSLGIVRQALADLPPGPFMAQDKRVTAANPREGIKVPAGEVYLSVESPRGELGYYLVSDGSNKPQRLHVRGPSFFNVQVLPQLIEGGLISDAVVAIASVDPVLGDVDR